MLKNYLKIAIAVLKRRKFFTFISLFGISFTLTILIVATAFVDNITSPNYPETNRDRSLYITSISQRSAKEFNLMNSSPSYYYLEHYVTTMKTPAKVAIATFFTATNAYVNNKKLVVNMKHTNQAFWDVMQFDFVEGKPYSQQQIDNSERVAVISEDTKRDYFGDVPTVAGQYMEVDNVKYRISGVVKSVPVTSPISYADMYVPYTVSKVDYKRKSLDGQFTAVLLANAKDDLPKMKAEYAGIVARIKPDQKGFDIFSSFADNYVESFLRTSPLSSGGDSGMGKLILIASIFLLLFLLLPTLNLVNINISRIMERSSEIGVRKAFGASSATLVGQFIIENLVLTVFGAVVGVGLATLFLAWFNNSALISNIHLTINFTVLLYSLLACLFFGLLSGVYPAWRMSRMEVVTALKAQ